MWEIFATEKALNNQIFPLKKLTNVKKEKTFLEIDEIVVEKFRHIY